MKIAENINKKVLIGIDGKPVASESETHWDEQGFLEIREPLDNEDNEGEDTVNPKYSTAENLQQNNILYKNYGDEKSSMQ